MGKTFSYNTATLSGALDVIVVEHEDGTMWSSPFHVRFGKMMLFNSRKKAISVFVNGQETSVSMSLGESGVAYFPNGLRESDMKENQEEVSEDSEVVAALKAIDRRENVAMSLWGDVTDMSDFNFSFESAAVPFEEFQWNPWGIINDNRLKFRINGVLHSWKEACPILLSSLIYSNPLEQECAPISLLNQWPIGSSKLKVLLQSNDLRQLGLKPGWNYAEFRTVSKVQGAKQLTCRIFLWRSIEKIVVSDIDGTITKSDVLGHILPAAGRDWSHPGIVALYNSIAAKGYKFIYLTARPIGQADRTRAYVSQLSQQGEFLPVGPILTSPDRLFDALLKEVVYRTPHVLKSKILYQVRWLFGEDTQPFYAGFGNRDTDTIAYRVVRIPMYRIFIVNSDSKILIMNNTQIQGYEGLQEVIEENF